MSAILFGSIGTIVDTSELQRSAYNKAFAHHGLDWTWDQGAYQDMLATSGGRDRVAAYAQQRGESVDAEAIHATKSEIFQNDMAEGITARPGVASAIQSAHSEGLKVGLVTTTSPENVTAMLSNIAAGLSDADFDLVVDTSAVQAAKPNPASYDYAMNSLGVTASDCVAIEDNTDGVSAAVDAGITCVAFPNENTSNHDFGRAAMTVDRIDTNQLTGLIK